MSSFYQNRLILAPMVRVSTLPFRLLSHHYGADLLFSPEIVDKAILKTIRRPNPLLQTIDYIDPNNKIIFQTIPSEKQRLIFQMGTSDPDLALKTALHVKQDVAGVDVNCGCPKKFSISGGMGAALLADKLKLQRILEKLVQESGMRVTAKIRILSSVKETIELCKMIEGTGVQAITVHCRTKDMKPNESAMWPVLTEIVNAVNIPVIGNGDVFEFEDAERMKRETGVSSVMFARGAMWNPSVFSRDGKLGNSIVCVEYLKKCVELLTCYQNPKFVLGMMLGENCDWKFKEKHFQTHSMLELCQVYGIEEFYLSTMERLKMAKSL